MREFLRVAMFLVGTIPAVAAWVMLQPDDTPVAANACVVAGIGFVAMSLAILVIRD